MNRQKQLEIHEMLSVANSSCQSTLFHYRAYRPSLDHESALNEIEKAIIHLEKAKATILKVTGESADQSTNIYFEATEEDKTYQKEFFRVASNKGNSITFPIPGGYKLPPLKEEG